MPIRTRQKCSRLQAVLNNPEEAQIESMPLSAARLITNVYNVTSWICHKPRSFLTRVTVKAARADIAAAKAFAQKKGEAPA